MRRQYWIFQIGYLFTDLEKVILRIIVDFRCLVPHWELSRLLKPFKDISLLIRKVD